jgi:hypothetical protein
MGVKYLTFADATYCVLQMAIGCGVSTMNVLVNQLMQCFLDNGWDAIHVGAIRESPLHESPHGMWVVG